MWGGGHAWGSGRTSEQGKEVFDGFVRAEGPPRVVQGEGDVGARARPAPGEHEQVLDDTDDAVRPV